MAGMNYELIAIGAVLVLLLAWAFVTLRAAHAKRNNGIDLNDLIKGIDGKISPERCILLTAFGFHCLWIAYMTMIGKADNGMMATYSTIWVTPLLLKVFTNAGIEKAKVTPAATDDSTQVVGANINVTGSVEAPEPAASAMTASKKR